MTPQVGFLSQRKKKKGKKERRSKKRYKETKKETPDDPYYRLGPVHTCLYVRVRETGDWDLFLGPLEWARAETGGADRLVL